MAEGRMIKKRISKSQKFARLKSDKARLLYLMIYPHLDIEGKIEVHPKLIKGEIVPLLHYSYAQIENCLNNLHEECLITLYEVGDTKYAKFHRFEDFQVLREDRESPSKIPNPPALRRNSIGSPAISKDKLSKDKYIGLIKDFFSYYNEKLKEKGWILKDHLLTYQRKRIIESRLKEGRSLEDLKKCVDNFLLDTWEDRHKFIDIKYIIGIVRGIDMLEKWLDYKPAIKKKTWVD